MSKRFATRLLSTEQENLTAQKNKVSKKIDLDLNLSCAKDFRNLISMVTWCIS